MKNIDKIQQMGEEDLADLLSHLRCKGCIAKDLCNHYLGTDKGGKSCKEIFIEWLNQEVNPMPKLEVGDVVKTEYGEYVVIDDNKVVNPTTMKRSKFKNIRVTTRFIYRYSEDEYKEIWSVYND